MVTYVCKACSSSEGEMTFSLEREGSMEPVYATRCPKCGALVHSRDVGIK